VDAVLSISVAAAGMKQFKRAAPRVNFVMQAHGTSWGEFQSKWRSGQPLQWAKSVKNLLWLFKDAAIYRWFDHIVLVGDTLVEQFKRWPMPTVAGATPWTLIRNGVNEEVFRPDPDARVRVRKHLGIPASAPLLAFAARLHPQKGGMELLQAFHELRKHCPGCELMIIGDGEDAARLRRFAASQDWHAQVHFTGSLDRAQVPDYLAAADAFAFPTLRKEGLPMNVLEALSCGLPAVCSEQTRDVFAADLPLYFAQPTAPLGFASACLRAFQEPHVARNLLTSSYLLSACADAYLAVLGEATC
jgi:glycosyltransferase involved in cell wall biosynthesis